MVYYSIKQKVQKTQCMKVKKVQKTQCVKLKNTFANVQKCFKILSQTCKNALKYFRKRAKRIDILLNFNYMR